MAPQGTQESTTHYNGARKKVALPISYSPEWAALKEHVNEMNSM